jgi:hypothetical protein
MYLPRQVSPLNFGDVLLANHAESIMTITGFFTIFACSVVLARLYVRAVMLKTFGIDDYIMTVAMVPQTHQISPSSKLTIVGLFGNSICLFCGRNQAGSWGAYGKPPSDEQFQHDIALVLFPQLAAGHRNYECQVVGRILLAQTSSRKMV